MRIVSVQRGLPAVALLLAVLLAAASAQQASSQRSDSSRADSQRADSQRAGRQTPERRSPADGPAATDDATSRTSRRRLQSVTPEREAAAMTFVRQHHPEIAGLLESLKRRSPRNYQRAVAELFRTSERLAQSHERSPERYELELDLWKAQSRAQLLAARLSMSDQAELRQRLREALGEQVEAKKRLLLLERRRVQARLDKLTEQIEQIDAKQEQYIDQQVEQLTRRGKPAAKGSKTLPTGTSPPARDRTGEKSGTSAGRKAASGDRRP